jgi:hypothetical protein
MTSCGASPAARRLFEDVWNHGNLEAAGEIVDQQYSSIENQTFPSAPGPQIVAADLELYRSLYDGLNFKIKRMYTEGHTIEAEGVSLTEVRDGKIKAHRFLWPRDPLSP